MKTKTIKRRKNEHDSEFMERAAVLARAIGGSVDAGNGAICPRCAPFGSSPTGVAEILRYQACYNCEYGQTETEAR